MTLEVIIFSVYLKLRVIVMEVVIKGFYRTRAAGP